jgi:hypothetical protein
VTDTGYFDLVHNCGYSDTEYSIMGLPVSSQVIITGSVNNDGNTTRFTAKIIVGNGLIDINPADIGTFFFRWMAYK